MTNVSQLRISHFTGCKLGSKEIFDQIRDYMIAKHDALIGGQQYASASVVNDMLEDIHNMFHGGVK